MMDQEKEMLTPSADKVKKTDSNKKIQSTLFWLKFTGVFQILIGAILCFSPILIFIGIFCLISGGYLFAISNKISSSRINESDSFSIENFKTYFKLQGIMLILILTFFTIALILSIISFSAVFGSISGFAKTISYPSYQFWQF